MSELMELGVRVCFKGLQGVTHGGQHEVHVWEPAWGGGGDAWGLHGGNLVDLHEGVLTGCTGVCNGVYMGAPIQPAWRYPWGMHGCLPGDLHGDTSRGVHEGMHGSTPGGLHRGLFGCKHRGQHGVMQRGPHQGTHGVIITCWFNWCQASNSIQVSVEVMNVGMHACEFGPSGVCKDRVTEAVAVDVLLTLIAQHA